MAAVNLTITLESTLIAELTDSDTEMLGELVLNEARRYLLGEWKDHEPIEPPDLGGP